MSIVTLITDFGTRDPYVGALKGVILQIAPQVNIVDISHEIEPQNVLHGAFVLRHVWTWYPPETIHLAVVDPGVGSDRRVIVGRYSGRFIIAPDNGLVTLVHRELTAEAMHTVENPRFFLPGPSRTFHGRDVMAPVAAHLANGVRLPEFGPATDRLELLPVEHVAVNTGHSVRGSVLHVDKFGTLVTNIRLEQVMAMSSARLPAEVVVNGTSIGPVRSTFSDVPVGEAIAFIGSCGLLEIAVNQGSAATRFSPLRSVHIEVR